MNTSHLIIFFHGIGASGQQLAPLASTWRSQLPTSAFATPDAPHRNGYGGHQWFKLDGMQLDPARIRQAREAFDRTFREVLTREGFVGRLDKVFFVGVSQGAIVALDGVAAGRWMIGGLVAFSGLLAPGPVSRESNRTPVLLIHGADDRTIPSMASTVAAGSCGPRGIGDAGYRTPYRAHDIDGGGGQGTAVHPEVAELTDF